MPSTSGYKPTRYKLMAENEMTQLSKLIKISGAANVLSAVLLLLFWFLFALLMPYQDLPTAQTLAILVRDPDWLFINLLGVQGAMVGLAGFIGLHVWWIEGSGKLGLAGLTSGFIGLVMLTAQLMWEAFIWKVLIADYSDIFKFTGPLYSSPLFLGVAITAGLLFTVGFILTGLMLSRREPTLRIAAWCLVIGAPLFGLGALAGTAQVIVRSVGIVIFAVGLVWVGYRQWRAME